MQQESFKINRLDSAKVVAPFVSAIITTYNRAGLLKRALQSLALQTLSPEEFEVIVVDDGSEDNTAAVCAAMGQAMPNLHYIPAGRNLGIARAGNLGIRSAKGDFIIFTDDDCIARHDWAERMRDALGNHPLVAGSILSPTSNFFKLCHNIAEFHPFMEGRKAGPVGFIAGANMGFHRSVYEELQGFSEENTISSDMRFILKARQAGYEIYFAPQAVITHDHERTSLATIFRYSAYHASQTILLRNRYRQLLQTPFVLRSPLLLIAAAPVIALRVTAGIYFGNFRNLKYILTLPVVYGLKLAWCWGAARGLRDWQISGAHDSWAE